MARGITNFRYRCDPLLGAQDREILADQIIQRITGRTERGLDIDNSRFTGYSRSYREELRKIGARSNVDLTLTGEMLASIELLDHGPGFIEVGISPGTYASRKARWNQGGNSNIPSRPFMGIRDSEAKSLEAPILEDSPVVAAERFLRENDVISGIFSNLTLDFDNG